MKEIKVEISEKYSTFFIVDLILWVNSGNVVHAARVTQPAIPCQRNKHDNIEEYVYLCRPLSVGERI